MKEITSLNKKEVGIYIAKGLEWMGKHEAHVHNVIGEREVEYPPSGSDIFHPELCKSGHWRYFLIQKARLFEELYK